MFGLNLSPSHCSTSHALHNKNMNALHDDWVLLDANDYTSTDSINSDSNTSDAASDNESIDDDHLIMMNANLKKYLDANVTKSDFTFNKACYDLMVDDILGVRKITIDLLRDAKDDVVVDLRLWKSMKQ